MAKVLTPRDYDRRPDATPLGLLSFVKLLPQGGREARRPWAVLHNRFAVSFRYATFEYYGFRLWCPAWSYTPAV